VPYVYLLRREAPASEIIGVYTAAWLAGKKALEMDPDVFRAWTREFSDQWSSGLWRIDRMQLEDS
jgi:hypothetical protein